MTAIYAIYSGRSNAVRYVGQTTSNLETRYAQHLRGQIGRVSSRVRQWMLRELSDAFPVKIVLLERCQPDQADALETRLINSFDNLLNERHYHRPRTPEALRLATPKVPKISAYLRDHIFHVDGRQGIHFRHSVSAYFVMMPGGKLLPGDELPGGSSPIWFSDLARAETAKERALQIRRAASRPLPRAYTDLLA